jgi:hypothetical protein
LLISTLFFVISFNAVEVGRTFALESYKILKICKKIFPINLTIIEDALQ